MLTVRMHADDDPLTFTGTTHRDFPRLADVGDASDDIDGDLLGEIFKPAEWDKTSRPSRSSPAHRTVALRAAATARRPACAQAKRA